MRLRDSYAEHYEEGGAWPALSDLLAATTLIFLVLFAVIAVPALQKVQALGEVANTLAFLEDSVKADSSLAVEKVGDYLRITIGGDVVFPENRASLGDMSDEGRRRLGTIAAMLRRPHIVQQIDQIQVVGHTSSSGTEARNWTLSSERAVTVAQFFINSGLSVCKVTALGRGQYYPRNPKAALESARPDTADRRIELELRPVVKNDTTQARRQEQCVESKERGSRARATPQ